MKKINAKFEQLLEEKKFLTLLHRGANGGNIVENTADAVNIACRQGSDIVEIDISKSTDNDFFVFHDGGESRLLKTDKNLNEMSTAEIQKLFYYNELDCQLHKKVQFLKELLDKIPTDVFLNIDRSWEHWETFIPYLDSFEERHGYFMLKSPVKKEYLDILENHPVKYMYFPIIYNLEELDLIESYQNINLIGFEVIEKEDDFDFINSPRFDKYKKEGYMFLANAINLDDDTKLFGSLDDNLAITQAPELSWGKMLTMGINVIQTDWIDLLLAFREGK